MSTTKRCHVEVEGWAHSGVTRARVKSGAASTPHGPSPKQPPVLPSNSVRDQAGMEAVCMRVRKRMTNRTSFGMWSGLSILRRMDSRRFSSRVVITLCQAQSGDLTFSAGGSRPCRETGTYMWIQQKHRSCDLTIDARRSMTQSVLVNVGGGKMPTSGYRKRCSWQDKVKQREGGRTCLHAAVGAVTLGHDLDQHSARTMSRASISLAE